MLVCAKWKRANNLVVGVAEKLSLHYVHLASDMDSVVAESKYVHPGEVCNELDDISISVITYWINKINHTLKSMKMPFTSLYFHRHFGMFLLNTIFFNCFTSAMASGKLERMLSNRVSCGPRSGMNVKMKMKTWPETIHVDDGRAVSK